VELRPALLFAMITIVALVTAATAVLAQAVPDSMRSAGVTIAEWNAVQNEVARVAAARGASQAALEAVAMRLSESLVRNGRIDVDGVIQLLDERGERLVEFQNRLALLERADDPEVAALLGEARSAVLAGDLELGDAKLAQAVESDLAAIALSEVQTNARRSRAAEALAERGHLAFIRFDYLASARHYQQAAHTIPPVELALRRQYRTRYIVALEFFETLSEFENAARTRLPAPPRSVWDARNLLAVSASLGREVGLIEAADLFNMLKGNVRLRDQAYFGAGLSYLYLAGLTGESRSARFACLPGQADRRYLEEARRNLQVAVRLNPTARALREDGCAALALGDLQGAIGLFSRARSISDSDLAAAYLENALSLVTSQQSPITPER
jgi:hypothetical protein